MKPRRVVLLALAVILVALYAGYRHMARQDMIRSTLEWGRLASFPAEARDFTIATEGGLFTRAFRASFRAEPKVIEAWIKASPGLSDAAPEVAEPGQRKFVIKPGGGAQYAEVQVDDRVGLVRVYVYWS